MSQTVPLKSQSSDRYCGGGLCLLTFPTFQIGKYPITQGPMLIIVKDVFVHSVLLLSNMVTKKLMFTFLDMPHQVISYFELVKGNNAKK